MANFNPIIITTAGQDLLSQAVAGQGTLTFTAVSTSSAVVQYDVAAVQAMTELSDIQQTSTPISAILQDGTAQVSALFSNTLLTQGYAANTLGLYASIGSGSQTLFAVAIANEPDNIPAQSGLSPSNFYYQFNIAISDTSQITISVPQDGNLPASVFNQIFPGIQAPTVDNAGNVLQYSLDGWKYVHFVDLVYPIGSIYISVNNINPGTFFGGTWEVWGSGQVPVGVDASVAQFATAEKSGGALNHNHDIDVEQTILSTDQIPPHTHSVSGKTNTTGSHSHTFSLITENGPAGTGYQWSRTGAGTVYNTSLAGSHSHNVTGSAASTGGGEGHSHNASSSNASSLPPYITCYMWKRIA